MNNRDIGTTLDEIADLLEFQNANPFRVRAYRNAARRVKDLSEPLANIAADPNRELTEIEGIGKDLAQKIAELLSTGEIEMLLKLREEIPGGVLAMVRIPGMGPKKAALLRTELGVSSLDELKAACEADRVQGLKGFGKKTQEKILAGIDLAARAHERMYWSHADEIAQQLLAHMRELKSIRQMEIAGSYRRGRETIGDLDLLVDADDANAVMDQLGRFEELATVIGRGDTKMSIRLGRGLQIDCRVVPAKSFGAALQYFTGSKDHNVVLRGLAKDRGLRINEYGVFRAPAIKDSEAPGSAGSSPDPEDPNFKDANSLNYVAGRTEEELYAALDLPWFPPEMREAREEFNWAANGKLPKLLEVTDLVGDLHMHTTASDGKASLREMVVAAIDRGLKFIAITDHSPRVSMANGLNPDRLRAQWAEIERLRCDFDDFTILKGIECDILEKGGMDLPDDVLAEADWVIASVHYGQQQSREQITDRILGALENPHVSIIAHPTGRLIGRRESYAVDLDAVFKSAAKHGKLMEINANPARLDLDDVAAAAAKRHGIPIVISSDAHSTSGLDVLRYGVLQARRAGLTADDVANTKPWAAIRKMSGRR
ncbi:MAG TPA: helix-hairpin-helix domain-containing protein [Lacipirellulaceae bacterium]|jgi:DNA polymerase (family 10)|nr:helix-hairpin-helix domain-containing protein [Lacipirellulaceae bacterium]